MNFKHFVDSANQSIVGTARFTNGDGSIGIPIDSAGKLDHSTLPSGEYVVNVIDVNAVDGASKIVFGPHRVTVGDDGTLTLAHKGTS
jgi:hypothetical protein